MEFIISFLKSFIIGLIVIFILIYLPIGLIFNIWNIHDYELILKVLLCIISIILSINSFIEGCNNE